MVDDFVQIKVKSGSILRIRFDQIESVEEGGGPFVFLHTKGGVKHEMQKADAEKLIKRVDGISGWNGSIGLDEQDA